MGNTANVTRAKTQSSWISPSHLAALIRMCIISVSSHAFFTSDIILFWKLSQELQLLLNLVVSLIREVSKISHTIHVFLFDLSFPPWKIKFRRSGISDSLVTVLLPVSGTHYVRRGVFAWQLYTCNPTHQLMTLFFLWSIFHADQNKLVFVMWYNF